MQVVTPAPRPLWRRLFDADTDALADHGPEWIDAMCDDGRYVDASRLYELPDGRRFVLPLTRRRGMAGVGGWLACHPPAWGIGGLVGPGADAGVVTAVLADLRLAGAARTWVRPNPVQGAYWAAAARQPGTVVMPRRAHVIDLTGGPDAVLARMPASTRRGLRVAARRGVQVEMDRTGRLLPVHQQLVQAPILRWAEHQHEPAALARWRAARRDPPAKLEAIARHLGAALVVLVAYLDDRPVASNITLLGAAAHDTRAAIDRPVAGPVRAAELLQWRAIQLACEHGLPHPPPRRDWRLPKSAWLNSRNASERSGSTTREYRLRRILALAATARCGQRAAGAPVPRHSWTTRPDNGTWHGG
jgi:hypothetical protein